MKDRLAGFARILPWAALFAALVLGLWNLGGWLMNDDEGTYLYGAWRVSLGEVPYRDFTLVQTPLAFGVVGGLFRLTGPSIWAARAVSYLFMLGAAAILFMAGRRFLRLPRGAALAGAGIFLLNKHVFFLGRSFLPDNLMLLAGAAMLYAALAAESGPTGEGEGAGSGRGAAWWAGIFAGLAALAKLNGVFLFAGYGLFLAVSLLGRETRGAAWGRAWRAVAGFGLSFGAPFGLMLALVPGTFKYTLGFHLASGGGETGFSAGLVVDRWAKLIGNHNYALFALAFVGIWALFAAAKSAGRNTGGTGRDDVGAGHTDSKKASAGGLDTFAVPIPDSLNRDYKRYEASTPQMPRGSARGIERVSSGRRQVWLLAAMAAVACLPLFLPGKYFIRYVLPAFLPLALFFAAGAERVFGRPRGDGGGTPMPTLETAGGGKHPECSAASEKPGGPDAVPASRPRAPLGSRGASTRRAVLRAVGGVFAAALILLCLGPTLSPAKIGAYDAETRAMARIVAEATRPGQFVFGDDPFVNFLAGRPCPPRLVDVSGAMVRGGWVTAAAIETACEAAGVALIFVERGHSAHHLAALPDAAAFRAYLDRRFYLWRTLKREFLDVDIYLRK